MKEVTHIDAVEDWQSKNDWDSHREALYLAWNNLDGFFIEMGCGYGSTSLLEFYCGLERMGFVSFDTDIEWAKNFTHTLVLNDLLELPPMEVSMLFVDSKPGEKRKDLIAKWKKFAKVIIAHDVEPGANYVYGMADILSTFKYQLYYRPEGKPHTAIVSNFINVEEWI